MRSATPHKTYHISVPSGDDQIVDWLAAQYNISLSIRELVREAIQAKGMNDLFVGKPCKRKPGARGRKKLPTTQSTTTSKVVDSTDVPIGKSPVKTGAGIHMNESILDDPFMGKNIGNDEVETKKASSSKIADLQSMMDA